MTEKQESPPTKRWSTKKKLEVVLRLFHGENIDDLSREVGVESFRLDEWRSQAINGIECGLKERIHDPIKIELDRAKKSIGDLSMENELLREKIEKKLPLKMRRSR